MTLEAFIKKYEGKTVGFPDGSYEGECLSLAKVYIKEVFNLDPPPSGSGSAYGYWSNFPNPLGTVFEKIENTASAVPKKGDIVIWKPWSTNQYGHIAIFNYGGVVTFESWDQNWGGRHTHRVQHDYINVVGWLHPKESMNTCLIANDDAGKKLFEELVTKATKYDEMVKAGASQPSDITDLKRQVKEANDSASTATQEATEARNQLKEVASKLNSPQDMPRILSAIEDMIKTTDQMTSNAKKDGDKIKEYEVSTIELKAEIKRLQLLIKGNKSIETATLVELLQEFFKRVTQIVKKG